MSISLYGSSRKPLLEIKPKLLKKADIAWLLSLPVMKVEGQKPANSCGQPGKEGVSDQNGKREDK
jgi:hypothetical protein